jgi:hypothetical protein
MEMLLSAGESRPKSRAYRRGRKSDELQRALFEAETGSADLIIGTHALFQERVRLTNGWGWSSSTNSSALAWRSVPV